LCCGARVGEKRRLNTTALVYMYVYIYIYTHFWALSCNWTWIILMFVSFQLCREWSKQKNIYHQSKNFNSYSGLYLWKFSLRWKIQNSKEIGKIRRIEGFPLPSSPIRNMTCGIDFSPKYPSKIYQPSTYVFSLHTGVKWQQPGELFLSALAII